MALQPGSRLGPYEIVSAIGAGGMGEVYRARDTRLNRDVALKVLPDLFADDPERLARFEREAQVLASINHPNIAAIYGLEQAGGIRALILELVEGPTLADRIAKGALPVDDALDIARQIAGALDAAHEKGIIHRDLKPANIKLRPDATVKVLDFGLAKAFDSEASGDPARSPTLTAAATRMGTILGTAAYMAPEQAKGKALDKRVDVWAFGCVLYEMLTGKRAFDAEDISDTVAAVLRDEPDWNAFPRDVPPQVRRVVKRCLDKDRNTRIPDLSVARFLMNEPADAGTGASGVVPRPARWRRALPWSLAGAALAIAAAVVALRPAPQARMTPRLSAEIGVDASLVTDSGPAAAVSPDGSMIAFVAQEKDGNPQLYVRRLEQLQATRLPGTDGARSPFFSPDGQWVAFFAAGKLKKISVAGSAPIVLSDVGTARGGDWAEDDTIVFQPSNIANGLQRVSASGGKPESITTLGEGETRQRWPQILPGARAVLYTTTNTPGTYDTAGSVVVQVLPNGARKVLVRGAYFGRYAPSGHLLYMHGTTLFAASFDPDRLELAGQPVPILERVSDDQTLGAAQIALSATGTLVYLPGQSAGSTTPILWMDREGKTVPLGASPLAWGNVEFAPDGQRLAFDIYDGRQTDIWVYELARDTLSRLTFDPAEDWQPVWTPDGRRIVFRSVRGGGGGAFNLYWQRADGTGDVQRLTQSAHAQNPGSWHSTGRFFAFIQSNPRTSNDIMILPMEGDERSGWKPGTPTVFLNSPSNEVQPTFSRDGRWMAYVSTESGHEEVYVRPFPGPGGKWQVSTDASTYPTPTWSRARNELFYTSTNGRLMVVPYIVEGDSFKADKPRLWSDRRVMARPRSALGRSFDLHPDGERFALATVPQVEPEGQASNVVFIFNFFDELKRLAPPRP